MKQVIEESMWNCKYMTLIHDTYKDANTTFRLQQETQPIQIRQGESLSPKLFILALENIGSSQDWEDKSIKINGSRLNYLKYVDDLMLIANSAKELQGMVPELHQASEKVWLMHISITEVMTNTENNIVINIKG